MQGIDKIIEKIIADAEADAKQTSDGTKKQIDEMRAKHEAQTQKQIDELLREFDDKKVQLEKRSETMAELEARRNMLAIKRELVEEAFTQAEKALVALSEKEYLSFIEKLMRNLDVKRGEVIVGRDEKRINAGFIDKVNKQTDSAYTLSGETGSFDGGFVLRNGRVETNCTIKMLVSQAKRGMEQQVAATLFKESGA